MKSEEVSPRIFSPSPFCFVGGIISQVRCKNGRELRDEIKGKADICVGKMRLMRVNNIPVLGDWREGRKMRADSVGNRKIPRGQAEISE